LKENNKLNKHEIGEAIYSQLFKNCCTKEEIDEYIETRKLTNYFMVDNIGKILGVVPIVTPFNLKIIPVLFLFLLFVPNPGIPNSALPSSSTEFSRLMVYSSEFLFKTTSVEPPILDFKCLVQLDERRTVKIVMTASFFFIVISFIMMQNISFPKILKEKIFMIC
jgi:hypothetical protein